jgi:ATP-dependent exoDNAse (exonuclease V) beta subunit
MSTEIQMTDVSTLNETPDGEEKEELVQEPESELVSKLSQLQADLEKTTKNLEAARKGEKFAKATKEELAKRVEELEAQGEWKTKYEQAEHKLKTLSLDSAIGDAAKAAKAKDVKAVLKLVDRDSIVIKDGVVDTKSVELAIAKAKGEFGVLFEEVQIPQAGRAAEGDVTGGFEKEVRAAKSIADITAIMKRYNKA